VKSRWKRVVLWSCVGVVVAIMATAGGFYLWFHTQVAASNQRVDPAILEALKETTSTTAPSIAAAQPAGGSTTTAPSDSVSGMNIVLVGYDKRAEGSAEETQGRSDTIILVHIDPDRNFISLLSVPRDTLADVPGYGLYKINAAFAFGGGALLIRTLQSELGVDLDHYIAVNLEGFQAITDALGGVYLDVDRPYLNETQSWEHIDLQPGYQLLNGMNALDFVRFRHDDNIDFGREARQQLFLTAMREQALGWNLTFKVPSLIKALFSNLDTDLTANDLIKLAYWIVKLDGSRIKQTEIKAKTGMIHGIFYVLPTDEELSAAVRDFYSPPDKSAQTGRGITSVSTTGTTAENQEPSTESTTSTTGTSTASTAAATPPVATTLQPVDLKGVKVDVIDATGRLGQGSLAAVWLDRQRATVTGISEATAAVAGASEVQYPSGRAKAAENVAQALGIGQVTENADVDQVTLVLGTSYLISGSQLTGSAAGASATPSVPDVSDWQDLAKNATFSLSAPTYLPANVTYSYQRAYDIVANDGGKPAVRVGYQRSGADQYLGVSESPWVDAPLTSAGVKVQGDGVVYTVVGSNTRVDHVWWVQNGLLYWITNTLYGDFDREQLLAVAMSMVPVAAETR
jgi:LCP family protein required for cell wall assembly